jgi:microcompartment protein CcmK/EutM
VRLGIVRGRVVLSVSVPALKGVRLVMLEPVTAANLAARNGQGGGKALIAADPLGAGAGEMVGFVEGSEAANPWWPERMPVDATCALVAESYIFRPPYGQSETKVQK